MFCVICFEDCDCLFRRRDKEIYSKCADAPIEKERVQRDKNGNMNNAAFYAVSSWILISKTQNTKVKTQKSPVSNTEHKTSVYKTQCHIQASVVRE